MNNAQLIDLLATALKKYIDADNAHIEHMKETGFEPSAADRARLSRTRLIIRDVAITLEKDNPKFNYDAFTAAAGLYE